MLKVIDNDSFKKPLRNKEMTLYLLELRVCCVHTKWSRNTFSVEAPLLGGLIYFPPPSVSVHWNLDTTPTVSKGTRIYS